MRQPLVRMVLAALLAAAALAQPALEQEIGARVTANGLKADVSFLASDALEGRGTPLLGPDIAAEYIAAQFRRAGLEPAGDDGYFQTASFANVTPVDQGLQLTLGNQPETSPWARNPWRFRKPPRWIWWPRPPFGFRRGHCRH